MLVPILQTQLCTEEFGLHGTTWRTSRRSMEVDETQPIAGKLVKIRCLNLAAEAAQITETQVICNNDKEVGLLGFVGPLHVAVKLIASCTSELPKMRRWIERLGYPESKNALAVSRDVPVYILTLHVRCT